MEVMLAGCILLSKIHFLNPGTSENGECRKPTSHFSMPEDKEVKTMAEDIKNRLME